MDSGAWLTCLLRILVLVIFLLLVAGAVVLLMILWRECNGFQCLS